MALIETRIWVIDSNFINRDAEQDEADATANNCTSIHGWPAEQIITYRDAHQLMPSYMDGWVKSEFHEPQEEQPVLKSRRRFELENADDIDLSMRQQDEINAILNITQDTTFHIGADLQVGDEYKLRVKNRSGEEQTITFDAAFLVDHEPALSGNDATIPDGFAGYLTFEALNPETFLLINLVVRQI